MIYILNHRYDDWDSCVEFLQSDLDEETILSLAEKLDLELLGTAEKINWINPMWVHEMDYFVSWCHVDEGDMPDELLEKLGKDFLTNLIKNYKSIFPDNESRIKDLQAVFDRIFASKK